VGQLIEKDYQINRKQTDEASQKSQERSNPMKVKTSAKAGNVLWGS
jgi:hypothetical protein